jgi:protein SCO1/2
MNKRLKNSTSKFLNDPRFQVLSVTVDPENDSAESLKEYAKYLGSNPYWYFLRSPIKNVEEFLVKGLGIGSPDDITLHTTRLTLIDTKARVRAYVSSSDSDDMEELSEEIETLLTEAK